MLLSAILADPQAALLYMERYVNKGSPSGFSRRFTTTPDYSPFTGLPEFQLPLFAFPITSVAVYGSIEKASRLIDDEKILFPLHPDMQAKLADEKGFPEFAGRNVSKTIRVVPTASGRTVCALDFQPPIYLKLHYDGVLGRVNRKLPWKKAVAGVEISDELITAAGGNLSTENFALLPEPLAMVKTCVTNSLSEEVGAILRCATPQPPLGDALIPCFALFSNDVIHAEHELLLIQLLRNYAHPWEVIRDHVLRPLLFGYCAIVFDHGLIPELNAQNVLIAIDKDCRFSGVVIRDLHGIEKDLSIRRRLNLNCDFQSAPYKCIDRLVDEKYYFIRHSFSYDFKLGEYILEEFLSHIAQYFRMNVFTLREEIRTIFKMACQGRDEDHFYPRDSWYVHERILLTGDRPYIELKNPKFRF